MQSKITEESVNSSVMSSKLAVTVDLDWASDIVIAELLGYLNRSKIPFTVFSTHDSKWVRERLSFMEVGLHPFFDYNSSQGQTIDDVVKYVLDLPHNLQGYRCHRYAVSNDSKAALKKAGMKFSSNVCTDLEIVLPFYDRWQILEFPIFFEDGGFLHAQHSLRLDGRLQRGIFADGLKVFTIHPMHFSANTPTWNYMLEIKSNYNRSQWNEIDENQLKTLRWGKYGMRNLIEDIFELAEKHSIQFTSLAKEEELIVQSKPRVSIPEKSFDQVK